MYRRRTGAVIIIRIIQYDAAMITIRKTLLIDVRLVTRGVIYEWNTDPNEGIIMGPF